MGEREAVEKWWPASGSCVEDCPHEVAKRFRDERLAEYRDELANDPKLAEDIAEFRRDMETLDAGGVEADALRQKWYDDNSSANLRLMMRQLEDTIAANAERDSWHQVAQVLAEKLRSLGVHGDLPSVAAALAAFDALEGTET